MTDLSDLSIAAAVRDAIRKIASDVVQLESPKPQFGRVISVNFVAMTATVWFPGDPNPVSVSMFSSVLPGKWQEKYGGAGSGSTSTSLIGFGSRVVVESLNGTPYITKVLNGGQFSVDFSSAGNLYSPYGQTGDPIDPISGDYTFTPIWDTTGNPPAIPALPSNGGPYSINIGPFIPYQSGSTANSTYEVEVIGLSGMSQKYEFNMNPYYTFSDNNPGSQFDRWFRIIPNLVDEMDKGANTGRTINNVYLIDNFTGLGDWTPETNTSAVLSQDFAHSAGGYSMKIQSTLSTATIGVREGGSKTYQVIAGSKYSLQMYVFSPTAWSDVRPAIDWYDVNGTFLSTFLPTASSIAANTWTFLFGNTFAPVGAVYGVPRIRIGGTPPITQAFYANEIYFGTADPSTRTDFSLDVAFRKTVHGSYDTNPNNSYGELWFRVYIHWLNSIGNPSWTVRVKSTAGYSSAKSTKTGKPVYEYVINPTDAVGYLGYHDSGVGYTQNATQYSALQKSPWSPGSWRNPDLTLAYRAQEVLTGGGITSWDGTNLKWNAPFEIGGVGRSRSGLMVGSAQISMPTTGQIPIFPEGNMTAVLTGTGIPLQPGQSLWFGIPPGLASATIPNAAYFNGGLHGAGGLFIVDSSSKWFWSPPEWAIFLAYRNTDATQSEIKLGTGGTIDKWRPLTLTSPYTSRGGNFRTVSYRRAPQNGLQFDGQFGFNNAANGSTLGVVPVGFRPLTSIVSYGVIGIVPAGSATPLAELDTAGNIKIWNIAASTGFGAIIGTGMLD